MEGRCIRCRSFPCHPFFCQFIIDGSPGGIRARIDLFTRQVPFCVGHRGVFGREEGGLKRAEGLTGLAQRNAHRRVSPPPSSLTKMAFPRGIAPRASCFANRCASDTPREQKMVRYAGAAPALSGWKPDVLAVTPIPRWELSGFSLAVFRLPDWKLAAGAGIAPASAVLQTAAHLSEPSSDGYQTRPLLNESLEQNLPSWV
jgi:hypothetical protein